MMISAAAAFLALSCAAAQADVSEILRADYEAKLISSGRNFPQINLRENNLQEILILLHHQVPSEKIRSHFGWSAGDYLQHIETLAANDFIRPDRSGSLRPTYMVISLEDGKALSRLARELAVPLSRLAANSLPEVRRKLGQIEPFRRIPFQAVSLLILSDVLLDNWQINRVEREFLKAPRTPRHGMNYYYSLQEKSGTDREAFGIYGNQVLGLGDIQVCIYGNRRRSGVNFQTAGIEDLVELFGTPRHANLRQFKFYLAQTLIRLREDPDFVATDRVKSGFRRLGLMVGERVSVPVLKAQDYQALFDVAAIIGDDVIGFLEENRGKVEDAYRASVYAEEISFAEYMIWWYHFLYSETTELLAKQGLIDMPDSGITTYLVDRRTRRD